MKYKYLCLLSFFFILIFANFSYSQVRFALKTGINIATTKDLIAFPKNRIGWYFGGSISIPLRKKFFLQPELLYSSKGYRYVDLSDGKIVAMRLNYLNFPILLGYKIDHKTKIVFGTELGYLVNAMLDKKINANSSFPEKFDMGLAIELAYNIRKRLGAEVRYIYGFKGFYQTDEVGSRRGETLAANRAFQIGVYYLLHK